MNNSTKYSKPDPVFHADRSEHALTGNPEDQAFDVYAHPEFLSYATENSLTAGVTAVILAGGNSTRMKSNKALLPYCGELFIERIHRQLASLFQDVILVTNTPELYRFLPCRTVPDIFTGKGALAGIHAGLRNSATPYIFVVACDMPQLNKSLIKGLLEKIDGQDVIMPETDGGLEPLHAIYGKGSLPGMEDYLSRGRKKIVDCCRQLNTTVIPREEIGNLDPGFLSFRNINTPEEYFRFRLEMQISGDEQ